MTHGAPAPDIAGDLRDLLDRIGYDEDAVVQRFGRPLLNPFPAELPRLRGRLDTSQPLEALMALFLLGTDIATDHAATALDGLGLQAAAHARLVAVEGERTRPRCRLTPVRGAVVVSDALCDRAVHVPRDHVPGVAWGSLLVIDLVGGDATGRVLDLGTGSGVLAVLLARVADEVVATDISPRAIAFARLTAGLNRCDNVSFVLGDRFDPVPGERFDLIVSNPPCALSPDDALTWRDGSPSGTPFVAGVMDAAPRYLVDGGRACVLLTWGHADDTEPGDAVRPWLPTTCSAAIVRTATVGPDGYIDLWWPRDAVTERDRWRRHLAELGYERVSGGAVLLRRGGEGVTVIDAEGVHGPELGRLIAPLW